MTNVKLVFSDKDGFQQKLARLSKARFDAVVEKSMTQIYIRATEDFTETGTGTPVKSGQLRLSLGKTGDTVGYAKTYAPHVEFGHRTKYGGYVKGRRFLRDNVEKQKPIVAADMLKQARRS